MAKAAKVDTHLVSLTAPASFAAEQYQGLRLTIERLGRSRDLKVIAISSPAAGDGKTVTAINLAGALARGGDERVLLIDADLRRPRQHSLFDVPNTSGLYEALGAEVDRKVHVVELSPRLSLLTAGRPGPDPVHVLTSERLTRVFEDAGTSFDWVIIDTPPVLVLPDAGLLMGLVDGAVFVVGAGMTTHRMAKRATDALGRDRIIGVVMNRADDSIIQDAYGGYGGYYGYASQASAAG
jgi:capsular exopolysaccharide synthesis family protein